MNVSDDGPRYDEPDEIQLRLECVRLRMRIESVGDALVQQMFDLDTRPYTRYVAARITAIVGRVPAVDVPTVWPVIAAARRAYQGLSDVLHGRTAWNRIPVNHVHAWRTAVSNLAALAVKLDLIDEGHDIKSRTNQAERRRI